MDKILYLVPGHGKKAPHRYDPGVVVNGTAEAVSVRLIAEEIRKHTPKGIRVVIDGEGYYSARHRRAGKLWTPKVGALAIVHIHHNSSASPKTKVALLMHDRRSKDGRGLARILADKFSSGVAPWGADTRIVAAYNDRKDAGASAWAYRAYGVMDEVYEMPVGVSAALVECGMLTHPETLEWYRSGDGVKVTAKMILAASERWLDLRSKKTRKEAP